MKKINIRQLFNRISTAIKGFFRKIKDSGFLLKVKESKVTQFFKSTLFMKILIWIFAFIALVQVVFAIMIYGFKMENNAVKFMARIVPYPVALVNYDFVTYNDYMNERDYIFHFYESTQQEDIDKNQIDEEILNQLIDNKLIYQKASENNISVSKKEIDDTLDQIVAQNGGKEKVEEVLDELYGLNLDQFKDLVKIQLLREKINNDLIARVKVSHILIRVDENAPQKDVDAAKKKIDGLRKQIIDGKDFAEVAKENSEDVGSAEQGGSLEPFAEGEMVEKFSDAAFDTPVGEISEPVRTEFGWHIIKVEEKTGKIKNSFTNWLEEGKESGLVWKFY